MSLVRGLLAAIERLRGRREGFDPFGPEAAEALARDPGLGALPGAPPATWDRVALLLAQGLELERNAQQVAPQAEFVMTSPPARSNARRTSGVIAEMLQGARSEVFALGYEISDPDVIRQFHEVARRARFVLICDRDRRSGPALLQGWPRDAIPPSIWQDRPQPGAATWSAMHGKALLVDGRDLLITSANFTFHGTRANIEFGIRLRDASVREAEAVFRDLLRSDLVERLGA